MEKSLREIIGAPIGQLELTQECLAYLRREGIVTIQDFIEAGWTGQKERKSFQVKFFNEVITRLGDQNLLYLMEGK